MANKTLHETLSDPGLTFTQKLKLASKHGLDYWYGRENPPNESPDVYRQFLKLLKEPISIAWNDRDSQKGQHALLGEQKVFKFEAEVTILGKKKKYFVKGYFYNENDLKGVVIQSFRDVTPKFQLVK